MAADIFSGALIIFRGLSSSITNCNAPSTGGKYFDLSAKFVKSNLENAIFKATGDMDPKDFGARFSTS